VGGRDLGVVEHEHLGGDEGGVIAVGDQGDADGADHQGKSVHFAFVMEIPASFHPT
jgi:hypothetical protein